MSLCRFPGGCADAAAQISQLRFNAERDQAFIARLQAERERRVSSTELGKLSEELEEDNWGSAATLIRSVMHELEDHRAKAGPSPQSTESK